MAKIEKHDGSDSLFELLQPSLDPKKKTISLAFVNLEGGN
jgi:hypothetical protein